MMTMRAPGCARLADSIDIGDGPQVMHARQFGAGAGQLAGTGADRQQQPVVGSAWALGEGRRRAPGWIGAPYA